MYEVFGVMDLLVQANPLYPEHFHLNNMEKLLILNKIISGSIIIISKR